MPSAGQCKIPPENARVQRTLGDRGLQPEPIHVGRVLAAVPFVADPSLEATPITIEGNTYGDLATASGDLTLVGHVVTRTLTNTTNIENRAMVLCRSSTHETHESCVRMREDACGALVPVLYRYGWN